MNAKEERYLRETPISQLTAYQRKQLEYLKKQDKLQAEAARLKVKDSAKAKREEINKTAKSEAEARANRPTTAPTPPAPRKPIASDIPPGSRPPGAPRQVGGISGAGAKRVNPIYRMLGRGGGSGGGGGLPENR